jgi:hypothetical protein
MGVMMGPDFDPRVFVGVVSHKFQVSDKQRLAVEPCMLRNVMSFRGADTRLTLPVQEAQRFRVHKMSGVTNGRKTYRSASPSYIHSLFRLVDRRAGVG